MAEILADRVVHALARLAGNTLEGRRQSAAAQRPGPDSAKQFYYDTDCTVYHDGIPEAIPALSLAQLWPGGGTTFDLTRYRYISFTIVGTRQHSIATQADWLTLTTSVDAIGIEYHTRSGWRRYQPLAGNIAPPTPPIEIIVSDGGEDFPITYGSNPYILHGKFSAGTLVLSLWTTAFGGGGSFNPEPSGTIEDEYPAYQGPSYPDGVDWKLANFAAHAAAGDHWPLPYAWYDTANWQASDSHVDETFPLFPVWWPHWHVPVFGVTNDQGRFDPAQIWEANPPAPDSQLLQGTNTSYGTPGAYPARIEEEVLIRGNIALAAIHAGDSVTSVTIYGYFDLNMLTDDVYLNGGFLTLPGTEPGERIHEYGFPTPGDITDTLAQWNMGGDNLLTFKVRGTYTASPAHHTASAYVDVAFAVLEAGGSHYKRPPDNWQTTGTALYVPATLTDPGPFFGRGVTTAIDLGNVGAQGRAYFRHEFAIPDVALSGATLEITAETGIGAIYLNGQVIALRDETENLWAQHKVLTFTIPRTDLLRNATNTLAVQCYSATGPCRLVYKLTIR